MQSSRFSCNLRARRRSIAKIRYDRDSRDERNRGVRGVKICHWISTLQSFRCGFAMTDFFCFSASRFATAGRTSFVSGRRAHQDGETSCPYDVTHEECTSMANSARRERMRREGSVKGAKGATSPRVQSSPDLVQASAERLHSIERSASI